MPFSEVTVIVCGGSRCRKEGAGKLLRRAQKTLRKLDAGIPLVIVKSCRGHCKKAPLYCVDREDWTELATPKQIENDLENRVRARRKSA